MNLPISAGITPVFMQMGLLDEGSSISTTVFLVPGAPEGFEIKQLFPQLLLDQGGFAAFAERPPSTHPTVVVD